MSWAGVLAASGETLVPSSILDGLKRAAGRRVARPGSHSLLRPDVWSRLTTASPNRRLGRVGRRLAALTRLDPAAYGKAALAAYGVDVRDPLTDRRLIEFCLATPIEQFTADGRPRALGRRTLADRVPSEVLEARTRGYQAIDWHEGLDADRAGVASEVERLAGVPAAARLLDIDRLRRLVARWPTGGWHSEPVREDYRMALLRGLAVGRFVTRTLGVND